MIELAQMIVAMTGSRSKIEYLPLPADDPRQRKPDVRKASETLNWAPTVSLDSGLAATISYFESHLTRSNSLSMKAS
jgi:UDP-glucuronate decarboxylase